MRASTGLRGPLALAVLAALCAPDAHAAGAPNATGTPTECAVNETESSLYAEPGNHCDALKDALGRLPGARSRRAAAAPLWLLGGGAALAAHALLQATLRAGLGLPPDAVLLRPDAPAALCPLLRLAGDQFARWEAADGSAQAIPLSVAAAWSGESCETQESDRRRIEDFYMGLGGKYYTLHAGAAPAATRLLARRAAAAAAAAACRDWDQLRRPDCAFLAPRGERVLGELTAPPRDWPSECTCPSNVTECIAVLVAVEQGSEEDAARLARELCAAARLSPAPPLRPAALSDHSLRGALRTHNRSFLFVDYDWWGDAACGERVQPAPPLAGAAPLAAPLVPVLAAPTRLMRTYMPEVLDVLGAFRPANATLRRLVRNAPALGLAEAACEALARALPAVRRWLAGPEDAVVLYVVACDAGPRGFAADVQAVVADYLNGTEPTVRLEFSNASVRCDDADGLNEAFGNMTKGWLVTQVVGAVAMGAAGAGLLPGAAARRGLPLLLAEPPERPRAPLPPGSCAVSPGGARLLRALRWLLAGCGWRRLAVLHDERHAAKWQNFSGSGAAELVVHWQALGAGGAGARAALAALRARDARVVVLDAGAAAAERALAAAAAAGMGPARGYAWLVLRAAGERADWAPPPGAGFEYVTLSGWWRGGPGAPGGAGRLRAAAERRLAARWPPLAAPLLDALLMMVAGIQYFLARDPKFRNVRTEESRFQFLERLRNTSVAGVAQEQSCGAEPLVFVHRWGAGAAPRLVATWRPQPAAPAPAAACEPRVRDAAPCHTTSSGDAFAPTCHDAAWAVALGALLLAPPALWAAAAARRARLRRRDRAMEARLLGRSAAAAAAALRAHSVPRAALELLDELGAGHYGSVRLAVLRAPHRAPLAVAAKAPRAAAAAAAEAQAELLREAALLAALRHEHVVRFAGVCFEGAPLVLMEHAFHGDLRRYLRARRPALERARAGEPEPEAAHVGAAALTRLAREAAAALGYLAQQRLVHRDVRAANCLVDARRSLKLADFGLARRLDEPGAGAGEYLCRRRALFPVLWMAPESLARGVFSAASDVWSLGVLMLELATLGARPFGAWAAPRVLGHVRAGGAPPLPRDAAASTRGVAATCWRRAAAERPSAAQLVAWLAAHPRALRPALAPLEGDAGAPHDPEPNLYFEEWTA